MDGEAGRAAVGGQDARGTPLRLVVESAAPTEPPAAAADAALPTLELRAVSKRWQRGRRPVLSNIDLCVADGTAVLLTGHNGAGKTTLLRVASGLIAPDGGTVAVQGLCPERSRREFNRRICLLGAGDAGLYARLAVRKHLDLTGRLALLGRDERALSVERALDTFDLRPIAPDRVDRLSTGQRQRLRLAMAFLHEPRLALLDEPSASLDDQGIGLLRGALARLVARGGAAICCEPSGSRAQLPHDRRLVLEDGALHAA